VLAVGTVAQNVLPSPPSNSLLCLMRGLTLIMILSLVIESPGRQFGGSVLKVSAADQVAVDTDEVGVGAAIRSAILVSGWSGPLKQPTR